MSSSRTEFSIYDFDKICRTCLNEGQMKSLYEECTNDVCLIEKLMSCTFIQLSENDGLPFQICLECFNNITQAYNFGKKCEQSDMILRKTIEKFHKKLKQKNSNNINDKINTKLLRETRSKKQQSRNILDKENNTNELTVETEASDLNIGIIDIKNEESAPSVSLNIESLQSDLLQKIRLQNELFDNKVMVCESNENEFKSELVSIESDRKESVQVGFAKSDLTADVQNSTSQLTNHDHDHDYNSCASSNISCADNMERKQKRNIMKNDLENCTDNLNFDIDNSKQCSKRKLPYKLKTKPPYECKKCLEKFATFQLLKLHRQDIKHQSNSYGPKICKICSKPVRYSRMSQHMRVHTHEKPYCCEICGARFTISSNLRRHTLSRHSAEKPYKCDQCEKGFTRLALLKEHQRLHSGEKPFVCNFCGKAFAQSAGFRTHLFIHAKEGHEHTCSQCSRSFATRTLLKAHQLIHGEKRFLCSDCGRGFHSMILLRSHSRTHTGAKPYHCSTCGKAFSHAGSLKAHARIHTGHKPFICGVCDRAFTQRNHLKYHLRTHSGERPYRCSVCEKTFALNGNLTVHMRTHTGETPYLCPVCGKGFHDSSSMKKHKKGHTGNIQITNI